LTTVNAIDHIYDVNGSFGGPIKRDRLWFYSAHRKWGNGTTVAGLFENATPTAWVYTPDEGQPGVEDYVQRSHNLRLTWQAAENHKIKGSFDYQDHCDCHRGVSGGTTSPEAAHRRIYNPNNVPQAHWTYTPTNKFLIEASASARIFNWVNKPAHPDVTRETITVLEQSTNFRYRAAANYGEHLSSGADQKFSVSYITGTHAFKTGVQIHETWVRHEDVPWSGLQYTFRNQRPVSLTQWAVPFSTSERQKALLGLYAQDQWTLNRLTLNFGVRYDYNNSYVPEQRFGPGPFVPAREFEKVDCVPCWHDISPRLSVAYDLFGNGKTAIKFGWNRYMAEQTNEIARASNPVVTTVNSASRSWDDTNGDFVPQPAELGPLSNTNFGNVVVTSRYSDDLLTGMGARGYNWQTNASIQHEIMPGLAVDVGYHRTSWHNYYVTDNLLVGPGDYDPFCVTMPSDERLPGGGGNQVCGFYDITEEKFGKVNDLVVMDDSRTDVYNGIDATVRIRLPRGAFLGGGMSTGSQRLSNCTTPDSPYRRHCDTTSPFFRPQYKFSGSHPLPWDMQVSGVWQSLPGIPVNASYVATRDEVLPSLGRPLAGDQSTVVLNDMLEPFTVWEKGIHQFDVRVTKSLTIGAYRLQGMLDVYNVFNSSPVLAINTRFGRQWTRPTQILAARMLKIGGKLEF
jgi:hypothetical protein